MTKASYLLQIDACIVVWLLASLCWAEDIDLFTNPASTTDPANAPALLFAWDNRASFDANASETCLLGMPIDFQIISFQIGSSNILNLKTFFYPNGSYISESL